MIVSFSIQSALQGIQKNIRYSGWKPYFLLWLKPPFSRDLHEKPRPLCANFNFVSNAIPGFQSWCTLNSRARWGEHNVVFLTVGLCEWAFWGGAGLDVIQGGDASVEAPVDGAYVTRVTSSAGSESNSNHLASPGVKPYKQGSLGYGRGNKPMRGPEGSPPLVAWWPLYIKPMDSVHPSQGKRAGISIWYYLNLKVY